MVSTPPRELLPAVLLVTVGLFFCTIAITGAADPSRPTEYSVTEAEDRCSNSSTATHEFDELSPRAKAFFLAALRGGSSQTTIERGTPPDFSVAPGDQGSEELQLGDGLQYVSKDGQSYRLVVRGHVGLDFGWLYTAIIQVIGGVGLAVVGAISYLKSKVLLPSALLGVSAGFVITPLLWVVGLVRWAVRFQFSGAPILIALISILVAFYIGGSSRPLQGLY